MAALTCPTPADAPLWLYALAWLSGFIFGQIRRMCR